jgi:hypothetical protein
MQLLIIFLSISLIQTLDYDINNEQICTHKPFKIDFHHNCSRTRLIQNVSIPNTDEIIYISIIFESISNINTTLNITKSSTYNQKIYFTFLTLVEQNMYVNNKIILSLNNTTVNSYLYDTLSEQFIEVIKPFFIPTEFLLNNPYCILKEPNVLPPSDISRIYYLYTNETNLNFDLTISNYRISPLFNSFDTCYAVVTTLTTLAIGLIVGVCVLSLITLILIGICLKKQLTELYHIWKNWWANRHGTLPQITIHGTPSR